MLRINDISIKNVGRFKSLDLKFAERFNLICGPNGVGKSTILDCISEVFSRYFGAGVRKRAGSDKGEVLINAQTISGVENFKENFSHFEPLHGQWTQGRGDSSLFLIPLKTNRHFGYINVNAIAKDPSDSGRHNSLSLSGVLYEDIKNWFVNRFLFSAHDQVLSNQQIANLNIAKSIFEKLDPSVTFKSVNPGSLDLLVNTPNGEIYLEYLSSGFKSCVCLVFGIIKEIEYRFRDSHISADTYNGVLLIDELDLHMHPEWQAKIISILKSVFSKAQFIVSTHSPHMIQAAEPSEIIALQENGDGQVAQRDFAGGEYGFQGWTIEEILTDVMGMKDTRSTIYRDLEDKFEIAIASNNRREAEKLFSKIDSFLHPMNVQRKLFKLQFGRLEDSTDG